MRRSRRKTDPPKQPTEPVQIPSVPPLAEANGNTSITPNAPKMQASEQEASLTAKNYRLAKELSDLRQKYKDMERKSTKLSMENHAIQCSWRLALAQIEDLKKELATVQTTTAEQASTKSPDPIHRESLISVHAVNFENSSLISPFPNPKLEKDTPSSFFEKTIDTSLFPPQDVSPLPSPVTKGGYSDSRDHTPQTKNKAMNKKKSGMQSVKERFGDQFIESDESSEIAFGELRNSDFFHQEYKNTLPSTPEKGNDIEELNEQFDNYLTISKKDEKMETSFDAFEASFQTTFPMSFSVSNSKSSQSRDNGLLNDAYQHGDFGDSFFDNGNSIQDYDDVENARNQSSSSSPSKTDHKSIAINEEQDLFSLTSFSNPDAQINSESSKISNKTTQRSRRNSPTANDARNITNRSTPTSSRSIIERTEPIDAPMDEAQADEELHSPSLVLKRLQQRKSKPNTSATKDLSEEMRKLDAIATSASPQSNLESSTTTSSTRSSRRRNVSQPVSYAEPPLNSKLRRGDVFFPMKERNEDESPTSVDELQSLKERQSPVISPQLEL